MENMRRPLRKLGFGRCRYCGGRIQVLHTESTISDVNEEGYPVKSDVVYTKIVGRCSNCDSMSRLMEHKMRYVPDSDIVRGRLEKESVRETKTTIGNKNPILEDY